MNTPEEIRLTLVKLVLEFHVNGTEQAFAVYSDGIDQLSRPVSLEQVTKLSARMAAGQVVTDQKAPLAARTVTDQKTAPSETGGPWDDVPWPKDTDQEQSDTEDRPTLAVEAARGRVLRGDQGLRRPREAEAHDPRKIIASAPKNTRLDLAGLGVSGPKPRRVVSQDERGNPVPDGGAVTISEENGDALGSI